MAIKVGYIDNERVYVFDWMSHPIVGKGFDTGSCQVFKHRDMVKMLNRYLKVFEGANNQNMPGMLLFSLIHDLESYDAKNFMPYGIVHKEEVIFDDEKKINKTIMPRLRLPRRSASPKNVHGLKVISGGKISITY